MTEKRQLLINVIIAVALSALHRVIEESAYLAMRFTAGKMSERVTVVDPYLYRSPSLLGGVSGFQGRGTDPRASGVAIKPATQKQPNNAYGSRQQHPVTGPQGYMYDPYDPWQ